VISWLIVTSKACSQPAVLVRLAVEYVSVAFPHDTEQALCNNRSPTLTSLGGAALCNSLPDSPIGNNRSPTLTSLGGAALCNSLPDSLIGK